MLRPSAPTAYLWACLLLVASASVCRAWEARPYALVNPVPSTSHLQVAQEGLALLESIDKPVAPIVVIGPYRSGKSFLLNQLLGVPCSEWYQRGAVPAAVTACAVCKAKGPCAAYPAVMQQQQQSAAAPAPQQHWRYAQAAAELWGCRGQGGAVPRQAASSCPSWRSLLLSAQSCSSDLAESPHVC